DGLLTSRWEDAGEVGGSRPRRRLYQVSDKALGVLQRSRALQAPAPATRPRLASQ
ncbi:MAG: hypothetical protein QOF18_2599, partial [Frankiaceae bacterium]|nr:hypothetical protein [Frankiaceae bacterium]